MDIGRYKAVTKSLAVEHKGEVINVEYRPNIYSFGFQRRLKSAVESENVDGLAETYGELIASWDLLEDGAPIPLTMEGVERVPLWILLSIQEAIADDLGVPSEEEKKGSSEPSPSLPQTSTPRSTGTQPTDQSLSNGSETFESQTASVVDPTS